MRTSPSIQMLIGGAGLVLLWLAGNGLYFGTYRFWDVPFEHQVHLLLVAALAVTILTRALTVRGSLEDKVQQVLVSSAVLFGAYALLILLGRQFFSRAIMLSMIPATMAFALLIIWLRHKRAGMQAAIIAPLVGKIPIQAATAAVVTDPYADFRNYDVILIDLHEPVTADWARVLSRAMMSGCRVRHIGDHIEELVGAVNLEDFELEHMASTELSSYIQLKRLFDILGALIAVPFAIPIILIGALAVLVFDGRPVFFTQARVGLGGELFRIWKLRTMRASPDQNHQAAVVGDPRITPLGHFLRRMRVDELPQLWNVLKGDMSLIGPRPEAAELHDAYVEVHPKFAYRCLVRPGITGWAQVNAPPSATADEAAFKLTYDLFYVKRQSMVMDLRIAVATIWTVFYGRGVR